MRRTVLDASAVVGFFEDRPGAEKVEEMLSQGIAGKAELLMSVVNWGEIYYSVWRAKGESAARKVMAEIAQLPIEIITADLTLTKLAAEIRAQHKLPYADCFAAALAKLRKARVATSDQDFSVLKSAVEILFI